MVDTNLEGIELVFWYLLTSFLFGMFSTSIIGTPENADQLAILVFILIVGLFWPIVLMYNLLFLIVGIATLFLGMGGDDRLTEVMNHVFNTVAMILIPAFTAICVILVRNAINASSYKIPRGKIRARKLREIKPAVSLTTAKNVIVEPSSNMMIKKDLQRQALIRQQQEKERKIRDQMKKIESLVRMTDKIRVDDLSALLDLTRTSLLDKLLIWSEQFPLRLDGDFVIVEDDFRKDQVKVKEFTETITRTATCYYCGAILEKGCAICYDCSKPVLTCDICKRSISFTEVIGECLYCGHEFHYSHLLETIKVTGSCPVCKKELKEDEVVSKDNITKKDKISQ